MATLSAISHHEKIREHYQQLKARGKFSKVALVACMRKFLGIINAIYKEYLIEKI